MEKLQFSDRNQRQQKRKHYTLTEMIVCLDAVVVIVFAVFAVILWLTIYFFVYCQFCIFSDRTNPSFLVQRKGTTEFSVTTEPRIAKGMAKPLNWVVGTKLAQSVWRFSIGLRIFSEEVPYVHATCKVRNTTLISECNRSFS